MPRIVPSEVVRAIDEWCPWAKDRNTALSKRTEARFIGLNILPGLVEMLTHVPEELLIIETSEAGAFLMARAALSHESQLLASGVRKDWVQWPVLGQRDCVEIVRTALSKCRDEAVSTSGTELKFLKDPDLETTLQTDLGSVERTLANGEWKAATVISGLIIEALLLWAVEQHEEKDIEVAIRQALGEKKLSKDRDRWDLFELTEVAHGLMEISDDTLGIVGPSRKFRDAIHPGRVRRIGIQCDRSTAYAAYGAVLNVVRELSTKHQ
jgi:hypothetical protein